MSASPRTNPIDPTPWIEDYEGGLVRTVLPIKTVYGLYQTYCMNEAVLTSDLISKNGSKLDQVNNLLQGEITNSYALEISKNMRYAPCDKIALEYGKCLVAEGKYEAGEQVLFRITQRLNADWRSVYRAFCVIAWSCRERGDTVGASRYKDLCQIANPQFPSILLNGTVALFQPIN